MNRLHPSNWPLAVWVLLAIGGGLLRVQFTLGGFSFGPAIALLSGTWLGWRRAARVQLVAGAVLVGVGVFFPELDGPADWGFRLGLVACAAIAGRIATPDGNGAHPSRSVRLAVFGAAGATIALVVVIVPRQSSGVMFALAFLMATSIAVFYAYRMVPEPGRVVGYVFCLLPYYALGMAWNLIVAHWMPITAAMARIPARWDDILFHAYITHLPSELIAIVVIAYLVCVLDRSGADRGPMAISAPR